MVKSSVILMLLIAQIFAGSFGVQSICLKSDGSFCCIDHGAETCNCCQHKEAAKVGCKCCHHEESNDDTHCCSIESVVALSADDDSISLLGCTTASEKAGGCKHIPISANPATTTHRVIVADALVHANFWICIPNESNSKELLVDHEFHPTLRGPPRTTTFALIASSSIMLRC